MRIETEHRRREIEVAREARKAARELADGDETGSLPLPLPLEQEQADSMGDADARLVGGGGIVEMDGDEGGDMVDERVEGKVEGEVEVEVACWAKLILLVLACCVRSLGLPIFR
mmetsp:Transcript_101627/g.291287  ORF Transcript_101627/g.291287 Transcript_101627/m.291287 type:complete len:114 (-) Transcript_101627:110-451(-)